MEAFTGRVRDRVLSDARWKKLQVQSNKSVCFVVRTSFLCYVLVLRDRSLERCNSRELSILTFPSLIIIAIESRLLL